MTVLSSTICPQCGASLRFRYRFPILTKDRSVVLAEGHASERLRYIAVWRCETDRCTYWRAATPSEISLNAPVRAHHSHT